MGIEKLCKAGESIRLSEKNSLPDALREIARLLEQDATGPKEAVLLAQVDQQMMMFWTGQSSASNASQVSAHIFMQLLDSLDSMIHGKPDMASFMIGNYDFSEEAKAVFARRFRE